jgi:putative tryptophan/tyrosine transport system ATP-binding protein
VLEIKNLYKTFNEGTLDEVCALKGIELKIERGSFVIVIGSNGSGKSTLLNAVAGSFFSDQGRVVLNGTDITKWPEHKRARMIGRVFQDPFSGTAPGMSIAENIVLASTRGKRRGLGKALTKSRIKAMKEKVEFLGMDLESRLDNEIGSLSGGQRQALTLLMATWQEPDLLLLDEHTAALDPKSADQVIRLTHDIVTSDKITTLMVTHSMQQAIKLGTRLIMMHKGKIVRDFKGKEKSRLRTGDLLHIFNELRRMDQFDPATATMLEENYV